MVKKKVKLSLFADDTILCSKDPTEFTGILLAPDKLLQQSYNRIQKSLFFFTKSKCYSNSLFSEQEIRKNNPFKITFSQN